MHKKSERCPHWHSHANTEDFLKETTKQKRDKWERDCTGNLEL